MNKKSQLTLIVSCVAVVVAALVTLAIIFIPALRQANAWSDGIDAGFFTRYPSGDRPAYFVHGPVSSITVGGKRISFDEQGRLTPQGDLQRVYDDAGRFDGFKIDGSSGKVSCTYDNNNQLLSRVEDFDFSKGSYDYEYYEDGNLQSEVIAFQEGDSLSVSLRRRFIVLEVDAYKNWTLRRTPDGELETRQITYFSDPEGEKALQPEISKLTYSLIRRKNSPATLYSLAYRYYSLSRTFEDKAEAYREKAVTLLERAAEADHADAKYLLGRCYELGIGKPVSREDADRLYEEAAEGGSLGGCILTSDRLFAAKEYVRALPFLERGAAEGDAVSSLRLGDAYRNGWGVDKDNAESLLNFRTASSDGNLLAFNRLGICYENGRGCERDSLSAFRSYQTGAWFGQMNAQFNLAECYRKGIGVSPDRFKAKHWYEQAGANGSASARDMLAKMEKEDLDTDEKAAGEEEERPAIDYKEYFNF